MKKLSIIWAILFCSFISTTAQSDKKEWDLLGAKAEKALNELDGSFERYFHRSSFIDKIIVQNPKNEDVRKFNEGFKRGMADFSISNSLSKSVIPYSYKYIGFKKDSSLVVRQWDKKDGGFNYLFLKVEKISEHWMIVDMYVVTTGDYMSATIKNTVYMPGILRMLDTKTGEKKYSILETYLEAYHLFGKGEYALAYSKISEIPLANRLKLHQVLKIKAASMLFEDEDEDNRYVRSIAEYEELFPNDPSLQIILLDKYTLAGEHHKTLEAIESMKDYALNDHYLNYYAGMIYIVLGDYNQAEKQIRIAIQGDEKESTYRWKLIAILEYRGHYAACVQLLDDIKKKSSDTDQEIAEMVETSHSYLFESKEYQNWAKKK